MIKRVRADERHFLDYGWLKTYWLFSFSEYYDPENIQFGALRVFNDDVIDPDGGFPTHPHEEMEIITIVLEGEISHEDNLGNRATIKAGEVQRMTAGTGLAHSEFNHGNQPTHLYQIWIYPDKKGLNPGYDQKSFAPALWKNKFFPVASGQNMKDAVTFHTDATIYRADLDPVSTLKFKTADDRRIFIYLTEGKCQINGQTLEINDQARIDLETSLTITAETRSGLILIDVPSCKGYGYDKEILRGRNKSR